MLKHVGKMKHNNAKVCVLYRTLPGEASSALVVGTAHLPDVYHNALMKEVESEHGQQANELADHLNNRYFPDGTNMLHQLHLTGRLVKVPTDGVIMTPASGSEVPLDQLNLIIAEQRNVAVDDLAILDAPIDSSKTKVEDVEIKNHGTRDLTEVEITDHSVTKTSTSSSMQEDQILNEAAPVKTARDYRSEADRLYKEAAKLRKMADEIDPPKKKVSAANTQEATQ